MKKLLLLFLLLISTPSFAQNPGFILRGTIAANDCIRAVNRTLGESAGGPCVVGSAGLAVGTTTITGGTNGFYLYNNAGVLGNQALPGGFTGFANPSVTVGLTAKNGTATTAMPSDAAPALDQSIIPTWTGLHTFTGKQSTTGTVGNVGGTSGLGLVGIGSAPVSGYALYTDAGTSASTTNELIAAQFSVAKSPASAANINAAAFGGVFLAKWQGSADSSAAAYVEGVQATAQIENTASVANMYGGEGAVLDFATGGNVVQAQGLWGRVNNTGAGGTIGTAIGVRADVTGGNATTNAIGVYVNQVDNATNRYGVKTQDILGGTLNYAVWTGLGKIHFGDVIEAAAGVPVTIQATAGLGANPALIITGGASASGTASLQITGGGIQLDNNQRLQFKDAGGTYRTIFQATSSDQTNIRSVGSGGLNFLDSGGTSVITVNDSTDAVQIRVGTGVSRLSVREGTSQSTSEAFGVYASDGTTLRLNVANGITSIASVKWSANNSTGSGAALLGSNSPASTLTAPYTWVAVTTSDGSTGYMPIWK